MKCVIEFDIPLAYQDNCDNKGAINLVHYVASKLYDDCGGWEDFGPHLTYYIYDPNGNRIGQLTVQR